MGLGALGLALVIGGGWFLYSTREQTAIEIIPAEDRQLTIWVDVGGAVEQPGVYELSLGSRLNEVLVRAGGLAADADREWVSRNLNLAQKAADGMKIYLPVLGEQTELSADLVNLNSAPENLLITLPGIGETRAKKIISNRPFLTWDEVEEILPANVYAEIKPLISL